MDSRCLISRMKVLALCAVASFAASASGVASIVDAAGDGSAIVPPYEESFSDESFTEVYTIIDANGDGTKWNPYLGKAEISYNSDEAMNDWLITPALALEGGKKYSFSIELMTGNSRTNEIFEIMYGTDKTSQAMVNVIVDKQSVAHTEWKVYTGTISPAESGVYYVGIHACSEADTYGISLRNLSIGAAAGASAPSAPTNLVVTTRTNGELKADISLVAPSTDLDGNELSELGSVKLMRNGELIKTFEAPAPGAELTFVDEVPGCSRYDYSAIAVNSSGESPAVETNAFVGVLEPANPTGITIEETSNPGEITISWEAVTADIRGNVLDPQYVTYRIYGGADNAVLLYDDIEGTSKTFKAVDDTSEQQFVQYSVVAETKGGISDFVDSPFLAIGSAYATPFVESFPDGVASHALAIYPGNTATWGAYTTTDTEIEAQDGDNGFFGSEANYLEDAGAVLTGKIDLAGLISPTLKFYIYNIIGDEGEENINELDVAAVVAGNSTLLKTFKMCDLSETEGWVAVSIPLDEYAEKVIQLEFMSRHNLLPYIFIDNIRVENDKSGGIEAVATDSEMKIAGMSGELIVSGAKDKILSVYTIDGRLVAMQKIKDADCRVAVDPGVYIVMVNRLATKVIVK